MPWPPPWRTLEGRSPQGWRWSSNINGAVELIQELLDTLVTRVERALGRHLAAVFWAFILLLAAGIYVRPATSTTALGVQYAELSRDPLRVFRPSPVGESVRPESVGIEHRLLTPVISYALGLRGERIIFTNLLIAAGLLGCVFAWFRRRVSRPGDALLAGAVVALSLVTLTTVYYGGYCDSMTYLIIFLMWWARSRPAVFYGLFFLGMLNHESIGFLIPWFALITRDQYRTRTQWILGTVVGVGLVLAIYVGYRALLTSRMTAGAPGAYLAPLRRDPLHWLRRSTPYQGLGLVSVFKLAWVFPCVAFLGLWRDGRRREAVAVALPIACAAGQFVVAYDSSRLFTLGFMSMVLALRYLFEEDRFGFRRWALPVLVVNLLIPQIFTAGNVVVVMAPTIVRIIQRL
jgi:hypothetical protein